MNTLKKLWNRLFPNVEPLTPGTYQYQAPPDSDFPYRLHLRLEPNGQGMLIINASTVLHLNQTAAEYAYYLVNQTDEEEVTRQMIRRYDVPREQALDDYLDLLGRLEILISTPDLDPVTFLGFDRLDPYSTEVSAPYRLDCALTYKVTESIPQEVAPLDRVDRELQTSEWRMIFDKAWKAGIPHIIFTGGEPTLRPDLNELIACAEELGQVTGLLTNGMRLSEPLYLQQLLQSGLDHLMILLNPMEEQVWEALRDVLAEDIYTTVHLTITHKNAPEIEALLDRLAEMEIQSLSLSIADSSLKNELESARQAASEHDLSLVWDLPVPYSRFHPVALELEQSEEQVNGSGRAWLYVEPDGDVLQAQGMPEVLGNLLTDPWEQIWKNI